MTEHRVFEILLKKSHDFPKLREDRATLIAKNLSDILYNTLKSKSDGASNDRMNILKFLQTLASSNGNNHFKLTEKNCHIFIDSLEEVISAEDDVWAFVTQVSGELEPSDLLKHIEDVYRRRNQQYQLNNKRMEPIKRYDQEALDAAKYPFKVDKKPLFYETDTKLLRELFEDEKKIFGHQTVDLKYREKQVKFAYAMTHFSNYSILKKILHRWNYKTLLDIEVNFLVYLVEKVDESELIDLVPSKFFFVYEKILINLCTSLLKASDVEDYLLTVKYSPKFNSLQLLCRKNSFFALKLKNMLSTLYFCSFCNENVVKFANLLTFPSDNQWNPRNLAGTSRV